MHCKCFTRLFKWTLLAECGIAILCKCWETDKRLPNGWKARLINVKFCRNLMKTYLSIFELLHKTRRNMKHFSGSLTSDANMSVSTAHAGEHCVLLSKRENIPRVPHTEGPSKLDRRELKWMLEWRDVFFFSTPTTSGSAVECRSKGYYEENKNICGNRRLAKKWSRTGSISGNDITFKEICCTKQKFSVGGGRMERRRRKRKSPRPVNEENKNFLAWINWIFPLAKMCASERERVGSFIKV